MTKRKEKNPDMNVFIKSKYEENLEGNNIEEQRFK